MESDRTYSTREIAQMWNVSESTVKRWADSFGLTCCRTPGGHRRFRLEDIYEFQEKRAFEATGLLSTDEWEDPELEIWLNSRNYKKVRELLLYLSHENQRAKVRFLLERLYLRGMRLEEIYDDVLADLGELIKELLQKKELTGGQALIATNNLEDALTHLTPRMLGRRSNGKTALCASPCPSTRLHVGIVSRVLEIEGWESLNLGPDVPFSLMSEIVETEPVNLVCLFIGSQSRRRPSDGLKGLGKITHAYRIPILLIGFEPDPEVAKALSAGDFFSNLRTFRRYISRIHS